MKQIKRIFLYPFRVLDVESRRRASRNERIGMRMRCAPRQFVYIVRLGFIRPREKKKMRFFVRYKVLVLTSFHDDDDDDEDEDDDGDGCKDGGGDDDDDG